VYGAIKRGKLFVFTTQMDGLLEELGTYSRELDEAGEPTEKIEDKETYHRLDGARYILSYLLRRSGCRCWTCSVTSRRGSCPSS